MQRAMLVRLQYPRCKFEGKFLSAISETSSRIVNCLPSGQTVLCQVNNILYLLNFMAPITIRYLVSTVIINCNDFSSCRLAIELIIEFSITVFVVLGACLSLFEFCAKKNHITVIDHLIV